MVRWGCVSLHGIVYCLLLLCQMGDLQNIPPPGLPLGLQSGAISESSLLASSTLVTVGGYFSPTMARLNMSGNGFLNGGWCAGRLTTSEWFQVDLLTTHLVTGVATQGLANGGQWIMAFEISYSMDEIAFENVKDNMDNNMLFTGNSDDNALVYNTLPSAVECRYVRLLPMKWNAWISLRMELYGSDLTTTTTTTAVSPTVPATTTTPVTSIAEEPSTLKMGTTSTTVRQPDMNIPTEAPTLTTIRATSSPIATMVTKHTTISNGVNPAEPNATMITPTNQGPITPTTTTNVTAISPFNNTQPNFTLTTSAAAMIPVSTRAPINRVIDEILNETVNVDNIGRISDKLYNVSEASDGFDEEDLQAITNILTSVISVASKHDVTEEVFVQVSSSVIGAIDNVLRTPEDVFQSISHEVSRNILESITSLMEAIQNTSSNNFTYSGSNIVLAAVKINKRRFPLTIGNGGEDDDVISFSANVGVPFNVAGVTSVSLPRAILSFVTGSNQMVSISVFILYSPKLFQEEKNLSTQSSVPNGQVQPRSVVGSPILGVTVEGADIEGLRFNDSIVFLFPVNQSLVDEYNNTIITPRCVYWDIDFAEWSDEGCRTEKAELEDHVLCRCNHLTSFAVLLDIKGSLVSKALDIISRIGCIASIICLIITLVILLGFRKLRVKQPQQILINLCFALLALYVTFIIGIDRPTWGVGCSVVAVLLHYLCLASLAWMGVEAFSMYMMFVRVMNTYIPKLLLKCCLVGWGTPLVVVTAAVAGKWTAYENPDYCFVLPGYSLYFGLLLPIGLILAFNSIIFVMVIYKLTCGRKTFSKSSATMSKNERMTRIRMDTIRRAQNAVAIGTLLGLTWSFGFLAFGGGRFVFNALFAIFNSLQGVLVFLLFGVRQPEVREKLRVVRIRLMQNVSSAHIRSSDSLTVSTSGAGVTPRSSVATTISMEKKPSSAEP